MNNKIIVILTIFYITLLSACNNGNISLNNPLVGVWKITKAEGTAASANKGIQYNFKANGNVTTGSGVIESKYKYTINNDTLKMDYNGNGNIILQWIFTINENKMTLKSITSNQQFWLEK